MRLDSTRGGNRRAGFAVAVLLAGLLMGVPAAGASECYGVQANATTQAIAPGVFSGVATFRFNGQAVSVPATTYVTGPDSTSHVFHTPWGTLVTNDELILVPVDPAAGLFSLRSRLTVVDGGWGKLHLLPESRLDLATFTATWEARGNLCVEG